MGSAASLKDFLKEKKARDEESGRAAEKEEKIRRRLTAITGFFDQIQGWLKQSADEGIIQIERNDYSHSDEHLGQLSEQSMIIRVGVSDVTFVPRTGTIAGAAARIDMTCGERTLPIILLSDRGWHFLVRGSVTRTDPVTEDSFSEALKEILDA